MNPSSPSELILLTDGRRYRRTGVCDGCQRPGVQAGQCCTYIMLPLARPLTHDEQYWLELHIGFSLRQTTEGQSVRVEARCSALAEDGLCSLFGSAARPQMCSDYPQSPEALVGIPQAVACVYKFDTIRYTEVLSSAGH